MEIGERIKQLLPQQRRQLAQRLADLAPETTDQRLIAYIVPKDGQTIHDDELRQFLTQRLPIAMVPSAFVAVDTIPRNVHGKVNRQALALQKADRIDRAKKSTPPRNDAERHLAEIWQRVLEVADVGIFDNFFTLGGDSILAIRVVAAARQQGMNLRPGDLMRRPTIAELVNVIAPDQPTEDHSKATSAAAGVPTKDDGDQTLDLTPIQHWFFEMQLPKPQHWNQAMAMETAPDLDPSLLRYALHQVVRRHEALRLRLVPTGQSWVQQITPLSGEHALKRIDLGHLLPDQQPPAMETAAAELHHGLDLTQGPLLGATWFDLGPGRPGRLLIVAHHLVVDHFSWGILIEDLQTAYRQASQGEPVVLPQPATTFEAWARRLIRDARSGAVDDQASFWKQQVDELAKAPALPVDLEDGPNTEGSTRRIESALDQATTKALLTQVPPVYNTRIQDALLVALIQAMASWTGRSSLVVGLEGHGRDVPGLDLARTVGWLTCFYPLHLRVKNPADIAESIKVVKEQLRCVPDGGWGYGVLRYLQNDQTIASSIAPDTGPQLIFNHLGRLHASSDTEPAIMRPVDAPIGPARDSGGHRPYLIEINSFVDQGRLRTSWHYSQHRHRRQTIQDLARSFDDALRAIVAHCRLDVAGGHTPSDFPDAGLNQDGLDAFLDRLT